MTRQAMMLWGLLLVLLLSACGVGGPSPAVLQPASPNEADPYAIERDYTGYFESDCVEEDWARILVGVHVGECRCESLRSWEDAAAASPWGVQYCQKPNYAGYGCFIDLDTGELFGDKCNAELYWERQ